MVWTSLVRGRYKESLQVGEKDVAAAAAVEVKGDEKDDKARHRELRIQDAADRPDRSARIRRRHHGSQGRRKPKPCAAGSRPATRPTPSSNRCQMPRSGRPSTKTSADLPPALREVLDKTPIGHLTAPEVTKQGVEMVALCDRKQTTVDTPKKKEIRDKMYNDEIRGEVEGVSGTGPQGRDDRISLMQLR